MTAAHDIVFLFDCDKTLLDNDCVQDDLRIHLARLFGAASRDRYWGIFEDRRAQFGYAEYLGARLDDDTRKIIEHGRRIRAWLKQPELAPVDVTEQIAILLALTAELFDPVPLDRMKDAEHAVHEPAARRSSLSRPGRNQNPNPGSNAGRKPNALKRSRSSKRRPGRNHEQCAHYASAGRCARTNDRAHARGNESGGPRAYRANQRFNRRTPCRFKSIPTITSKVAKCLLPT